MPAVFKHLYPSTRCIIDPTEVYIQRPQDPTAQQLRFSSYKNHNTFKALQTSQPSRFGREIHNFLTDLTTAYQSHDFT